MFPLPPSSRRRQVQCSIHPFCPPHRPTEQTTHFCDENSVPPARSFPADRGWSERVQLIQCSGHSDERRENEESTIASSSIVPSPLSLSVSLFVDRPFHFQSRAAFFPPSSTSATVCVRVRPSATLSDWFRFRPRPIRRCQNVPNRDEGDQNGRWARKQLPPAHPAHAM